MKKILANVLRVVISFGLLTYLVLTADVQKIYRTVISADLTYFGIALLIFSSTLCLLTFRWRILLRQNNIDPGYSRLLIYYLIGYFLNNFLPTTIGGDVSRAYNVAKISGKRATSFGTVLLERILGFLATLTLASLSMFWVIGYFHTSLIIFINTTLLLFVVFALFNLLNPALFNFTSKLLQKITILGIGDKVNRVLTSVHAFRHSKSSIFCAYLLSLCGQILLIMMNYVLAIALGLQQVTLGYLFLVVPVTIVIGMIPSINGIGVRDYGYRELLTRIGLLPAEALSLSFLNMIIPLLISLIGGVLLIFYRNNIAHPVINEAEAQVD
jgi:uncharacterized protein (TIRG00374 family)